MYKKIILPLLLVLVIACKSNKTQIFFIGDSITFGVGTTGTTSSFEGAKQVSGNKSYPKQAIELIADKDASFDIEGYPGQTAEWFTQNKLQSTLKKFDSKHIICVVFFGANEITMFNDANKIYSDIVELHRLLRKNGAKTIVVPILPRHDKYITAYSDSVRSKVNEMLSSNWKQFADGFADLISQPKIFNDNEDSLYYKFNDVDGLSKVHPTDIGAKVIAMEVAKEINRLKSK